jgi:hypothetical protein
MDGTKSAFKNQCESSLRAGLKACTTRNFETLSNTGVDAQVPPLRAWSLATFHTVSFVAALVAGVHVRGSLAAALGRLDTTLGVASFLGLWALTWTATRAGLRALEFDDDRGPASMVMRLTIAGGWNGIGIFAALIVVFLFNLASRGTPALTFVPLLFLGVSIGGSLAFTIGAVVGFVYGLVDAALLRGAAGLFRWTQGDLA